MEVRTFRHAGDECGEGELSLVARQVKGCGGASFAVRAGQSWTAERLGRSGKARNGESEQNQPEAHTPLCWPVPYAELA